ncbi:RNA polymerase sigma factor [Paenibacillus radicis (ex Xue et al. 2023)]|uniref:RNA polymerase sigma factor n=1 Tax=Paenibacillus radicis (ex Xue et al. 2023) TaxID=2972489 RepID=A0ABT1YIU3_9BACL|nr:RNA polymerase sigma factor [Paenibacillus radicis (ex Xue et al. 2023)]MCR8633100.1 RNA polymerase sigma factor [Paenibacillus radicis (ex Xue et al. 2023)]
MILTEAEANTRIKENLEDGKSVEQLQNHLNRYCLSLTGSIWDAEDLAQDTWLKALGNLKSQEHHSNPEALLLRIAKNTWIDQTRRNKVLDRILKREQPKVSMLDNDSFEIEAAFQALMKHLSPLQRTVFLLRDVLGFSIGDAAKLLKTTEGAMKAALHRARHALEAVKFDLKQGTLSLPEEEELRAFLRAIASAYQIGDITALMELSLRGEAVPAAAIGIVQYKLLQSSRSSLRRSSNSQPNARMAA